MKKSGICAIAKNEDKYILEWIAHHILLGFDSIVIYDNESDIDISTLISSLSYDVHIDIIKWPSKEGVSPQVSAYDHYVSRYSDKIQYTAFIDLDEFIFLNHGVQINNFLCQFLEVDSAIAMNQLCFGSSGHQEYKKDLVTRKFCHSSPLAFSENNFFKTLAKTATIQNFAHCHGVVLNKGRYVNSDGVPLSGGLVHKGRADNPSHQNLILHHYVLKSKEEFDIKRNRGDALTGKKISRYTEDAFYAHDSAYKVKYELPERYFVDMISLMKQLTKSDSAKDLFSKYYDFILPSNN